MSDCVPKRWRMSNARFDAYRVDCDRTLDAHWHSHFLLHLFTGGDGIQEINGKPYPVSRGSVIILSPTDFHRNVIKDGQSLSFCAVKISETAFYDSVGALCALNEFPIVTKLDGEDYETALFLFDRLIKEQMNTALIGSEQFLSSLVDPLIILTLRSVNTVSESAAPLKMRKALMYVHCNFRGQIKATDVAKHIGYSPNYFSAEFKRETGIEFRKYLQDLRLDFAMNLLKFSHLNVTEVCFESGFNTLPHFSKTFKKRFGMTPEQAKEKLA
ncbi:MAG: helix-turn-helix domain-containing protein [Ruminococcaceae bacterium]|nr:helix-turn-helix domain-containing protein [Oscillospiraceae bacterium]